MNIKAIPILIIAAAALLPSAVRSEDHKVDFPFTIPQGWYLSLRITFRSNWEENLVLWRASGDAIAQWNNYVSEGLSPRPNWGPWQDNNPNVPTSVRLVSKHKEGKPSTQLPWKETWMHIVQPLTETPDKAAMYGTVQWGDNSANDAVTVEIGMSADKSRSADFSN